MRICHITSRHNWDDDRIYQRACIGLHREGMEIHLIATYTGENPNNYGVIFHWLKPRNGWRSRIFSSIEAYQISTKIDADVFHFHDPDLLPWMLLLSLKGKRIIYDVHENYAERVTSLRFPQWAKQPIAMFWSFFERFCASQYAGIITTTQSMQYLFEGINTLKIVIGNTPYLSALGSINLNVDKKPYTIYTSGSHSDKRNCIQTIDALPIILRTLPKTRLIFVGRYSPKDYEYRLLNRAYELGVKDYVEIDGMLPYKENFIRTAQMEVGCVFYEDNANNRVTIPNRLFEYMYAGVAVIGETFFEVKKVIEDSECGIVVNSSDPKSIADGVIRLFSDLSSLRKMQTNARNRIISTYSYENELKKLIAMYHSLK
jgi:glycosyltransferase involved in cell wall biosynthesis